MPPPRHCGDRIEPWRARPVPFWRHGLRPPPLTCPRVLVSLVPRRAFASWRKCAWCITETFGSIPKTLSSSSTLPDCLPDREYAFTFIVRLSYLVGQTPYDLVCPALTAL